MNENIMPEPPAAHVFEAESLKIIFKKIDKLAKEGLEKFRDIGIELLRAKSLSKHGEFMANVEKNCPFSYESANRYIKLAENWSKVVTVTTLTEALDVISKGETADVETTSDESSESEATEKPPENPAIPGNSKPPKKLCHNCEIGRTAPDKRKGCKDCKALNPKPPKEEKPPEDAGDAWEPTSPDDAKPPDIEPMDALGTPLVKHVRDAFAGNTVALADCVKLLQKVKRTAKDLRAWNPYMRPGEIEKSLEDMIDDFKKGKPYAVCPSCGGEGCHETCRNEGWLPEWRYKEMSL